jgi:hypothetical protein
MTDAGQKAIADTPQLIRSNFHPSIQGVMKSPKRARTHDCGRPLAGGRSSTLMMMPMARQGTCDGLWCSRKRTL